MEPARRSRKSAPVKNAMFVGAMNKNRPRNKSSRDQNLSYKSGTDNSQDEIKTKRESIPRKQSRTNEASRSSAHFSRESSASNGSIRMSTPVRGCQTSPRYRTRQRSRQESDSEHDRSRSIISSVGSRRRFHPDYDPLIEIRRAKERLARYKTQGDWNIDVLLSDDAEEDLSRYEEKLKRRFAERGEPIESIDLERRQMELLRRQKDIDLGKVTERYAEYVLSVPKPERERYHPRTPNKFRKVSRRAWDGMIRKWRKHLHNFDDLNFEHSWRSLSTSDMSETGSNRSLLSGACSDIENLENVAPKDTVTLATAATSGKPSSSFQTVQMPDLDDEDTLQAQPHLFQQKTGRPKRADLEVEEHDDVGEEEDTLSALPKRNTRGNAKRLSIGPAPDVFHSGLTNDMNYLGSSSTTKRTASHLNQPVDITDTSAFPQLKPTLLLSSPSKRLKRGILTQNGLVGDNQQYNSPGPV